MESEFRAWRKRYIMRALIVCVIALPVGVALRHHYVWGLAILGIIVAPVKLAMTRKP